MKHNPKLFPIFLILLIALISNAIAQGRLIIPHPPIEFPVVQRGIPVHLQGVAATVDLKEGAGNVRLTQTFIIPGKLYADIPNYQRFLQLQMEGEYIFPLPGEAQAHDFYLYMNGTKTAGEVLDHKKAAEIYNGIVMRHRDPALLEYIGQGLLKARVFPMQLEQPQKIELSYAQVLSYDNSAYRFVLPIRQSGQGSIDQFDMTINLELQSGLGNVYSPSHDIDVEYLSDTRARISLSTRNLRGNKDFILYYSPSENNINTSILTFRPRTDRDGYFMLLAAPAIDKNRDQAELPKDVIFVIDVSGSMQGEKIDQAREALQYCVNSLSANDYFEIISFSSTIENFQGGLLPANEENKENARYFIENISAGGGTNINGALQEALELKDLKDRRLSSIIFLTDGLPTEGETNIEDILGNVQTARKAFFRIFNFGVGYDVNTYLLDKLAEDSNGSANYVKPGENIEREVSAFWAKNASPVLTDPQIDFGRLQVSEVYPQSLPDIFQGQRITLIGRYREASDGRIILSGNDGRRIERFSYPVTLDRRQRDNEFIAALWANRKVSHLMTQIRFNGENPELVETIKQLGEAYGIITPYTSYLVTEQEQEFSRMERARRQGTASADVKTLYSLQSANEAYLEEQEDISADEAYGALSSAPRSASQATGKSAVVTSQLMKKSSRAEKDRSLIVTVKRVADRSFRLQNGIWMESGIAPSTKPDRELAFLSEAYFAFSQRHPEINRILSIGEEILFQWQGEIIKISG